ncbi:MAG: HNH endonuclease, partial [Chloroflexus sp.]|nr:HNH endonuclease [Chloroflexus sp.]
FASAIAPADEYNEEELNEALRLLGQDPDRDLTCVYCDQPAETWDHLESLVENGKFRGYGHVIGNLVPCCKRCNSEKGAKSWKKYVKDPQKRKRIEDYARLAQKVCLGNVDKKLLDDYNSLRDQLLTVMEKADEIAEQIRNQLQTQLTQARSQAAASSHTAQSQQEL